VDGSAVKGFASFQSQLPGRDAERASNLSKLAVIAFILLPQVDGWAVEESAFFELRLPRRDSETSGGLFKQALRAFKEGPVSLLAQDYTP
jgi:hypothetical protein